MRPTVLASSVLALALMGDALLYPILPLHASAFGLSLAWVGVLLSANRIVRLFAFHGIAKAARSWGLRRITIASAAVGSLSTIAFALVDGPAPLLAARIAWGLSYGALALSTLGYATASASGAGGRIGVSLSLREVGPLLSLTAGTALVAAMGARPAMVTVGVVSLLAIPCALALPTKEQTSQYEAATRPSRPTRYDLLGGVFGLVVDGVFVTTIGLAFARDAGVGKAAAFVAAILVARRVALLLISPLGGRLADVFGTTRTLVCASLASGVGLLAIAAGATASGSIVLVAASAVAITVLPVAATERLRSHRIDSLARLNVARDVGAAAGPLLAAAAYTAMGPEFLYAAGGALLAMVALSASGLAVPRLRLFVGKAVPR